MTRRLLEIESLQQFDAHLARTSALRGWVVQAVDLTGRSAALAGVDARGAVFLGCTFAGDDEERLHRAGALVFPRLPDLPFDPYRAQLYTAAELYGTGAYADSPDAAVYAWSKSRAARALTGTLAAALHDHSVTESMDDLLARVPPTRVVGVMGGHALRRDEPDYAAAARLGDRLTREGRVVLSGGGPGAMEAAHLGAYLSPWPGALDGALSSLAAAPAYATELDAWAAAAFAVLARHPAADAGRSVSVPTWFYGHEPTAVFATFIAKYFANALREDTLLHRCRGGIVYLRGQAGTVQEIFQAVTENFYAADAGHVAPMILVGTDYWTRVLAAWPLLEQLGAARPMGGVLHCVDTVDEAADLLTEAD